MLRSHFATVAQTVRRLYVWGCVFTLAATAYTVLATVQVTKHSMANGAWISNSSAVWYMVALMWGIGGAIIWGWWNRLRRWHGGMEIVSIVIPLLIIVYYSMNFCHFFHQERAPPNEDVFRLAAVMAILPFFFTSIDIPRWLLVIALLSMATPLYLSPHSNDALYVYTSTALAFEVLGIYFLILRERTAFVNQLILHRAQDRIVQTEKRIVQLEAQQKLDELEHQHEIANRMQASQAAESQLRIIAAASHDLKQTMEALMTGCNVFRDCKDELPAATVEALEMMIMAWNSGSKTLSELMLGSRVITGAYQRPVTSVVCERCQHTQPLSMDDVDWMKFV